MMQGFPCARSRTTYHTLIVLSEIAWSGSHQRNFLSFRICCQFFEPTGKVTVRAISHPRTGATSIELDPLEWIHRITSHIPDPGRHCQRFYGAYCNRSRIRVGPAEAETVSAPAAKLLKSDNADFSNEARSTWARLIRKIFEADPLLCRCGGRMHIFSFITDPRVIDGILRHLKSPRSKAQDPFEPRAPPDAASAMVQ
jgi:hypothetical protein